MTSTPNSAADWPWRFATRSCFLAIKHASEAMKKTGGGKAEGGGSIVLTASGERKRPVPLGAGADCCGLFAVAGIRSGAGPIDYSASKAACVRPLSGRSSCKVAASADQQAPFQGDQHGPDFLPDPRRHQHPRREPSPSRPPCSLAATAALTRMSILAAATATPAERHLPRPDRDRNECATVLSAHLRLPSYLLIVRSWPPQRAP